MFAISWQFLLQSTLHSKGLLHNSDSIHFAHFYTYVFSTHPTMHSISAFHSGRDWIKILQYHDPELEYNYHYHLAVGRTIPRLNNLQTQYECGISLLPRGRFRAAEEFRVEKILAPSRRCPLGGRGEMQRCAPPSVHRMSRKCGD